MSEQVIRRYITNLQERGKYTFYADEKSRGTNFPERRRDYRQPVTTATINNYIRNLKVFFNWLDSEHWLSKNPMKKVKQLKTNRQKKEYLNDDEFKKLVGHLDKSYFSEHRDYAMIVLMLDTGMRLGECSSLLVSDIQLARHQIVLRAEMTKGRKDRQCFSHSAQRASCGAGFNTKTDTLTVIICFLSSIAADVYKCGISRLTSKNISDERD